ncbi:MAG: STAS domain-containing protein [Ignavibacteriaceae bacterium]|jgi:anti-anti-sigma factor
MESISTKTFLSRKLDPEFSESFKKERHENILIEIIKAKELDFRKTMHLKDVLDEDVSEGYNNILVDLSECDSIDSSFLGMLVQTNKKLKLNNGHLKIIGLNASSDNIIIFSGLTKLFHVFNNKQLAIQSCAA